jgi:hypothetical protein
MASDGKSASRSVKRATMIPLLRYLLEQGGPVGTTPVGAHLLPLTEQAKTNDRLKAIRLKELVDSTGKISGDDMREFLQYELHGWLIDAVPSWGLPPEPPVINQEPSPTDVSDKDKQAKVAAALGKR